MENMAFFGYHGVLPAEAELGQKFFVDMALELDLEAAGKTDSVEETVSYAEVFERVQYHFEKKRYALLEALAAAIVSDVLDKFSLVQAVNITVRKPEAPVKGIFGAFGVQIRRQRHG